MIYAFSFDYDNSLLSERGAGVEDSDRGVGTDAFFTPSPRGEGGQGGEASVTDEKKSPHCCRDPTL